MAKCRECDGKGYGYHPSVGCSGCGGSGEVSQSPEHMVSQPNLHPQEPQFSFGAFIPEWMEGKSVDEIESISLLRACRVHLRLQDEESSYDLAEEISTHFKKLGVE